MLYNQYLQELREAYMNERNVDSATSANQEGQSGADVDEDNLPINTEMSNGLELFDIQKVPEELKSRVMQRFKSKLGGRERRITTGGAPTDKLVKRFVIDCFAGMVSEGYGSTEVNVSYVSLTALWCTS